MYAPVLPSMLSRVWSIDARKLHHQVTGTGRTIAESLPIFRPTDRVIRAALPAAGINGKISSARLAAEPWMGRTLGSAVFQPWMFGAGGSSVTLLAIYDTVPLALGGMRAVLLRAVIERIKRSQRVHVLTLLHAVAEEIAGLGVPEGRIHAIMPGVNHLDLGGRGAMTGSRQGIVAVGRLSRHKNLGALVAAWQQTGKQIPLTIVIPEAELGTRDAARFSRQGVTVRGGLSDSAYARLLRGSLVFASPSLAEGFGLPAVEAAAARCVVLLTDMPVYRELPITDAVFVKGNRHAWAEAVRASVVMKPASLAEPPTWSAWRQRLVMLLQELS